MKTNLIFKRINNGKVEMILVPVDVPLKSGEGWTLASCCDSLTVLDEKQLEQETSPQEEKTPLVREIPQGGKYESSVAGTARLIRKDGTIHIAYRKGRNYTYPNSVCINDTDKLNFFSSVRKHRGSTSKWELNSSDSEYKFWDNLMDKLYENGRIEYNRNLKH